MIVDIEMDTTKRFRIILDLRDMYDDYRKFSLKFVEAKTDLQIEDLQQQIKRTFNITDDIVLVLVSESNHYFVPPGETQLVLRDGDLIRVKPKILLKSQKCHSIELSECSNGDKPHVGTNDCGVAKQQKKRKLQEADDTLDISAETFSAAINTKHTHSTKSNVSDDEILQSISERNTSYRNAHNSSSMNVDNSGANNSEAFLATDLSSCLCNVSETSKVQKRKENFINSNLRIKKSEFFETDDSCVMIEERPRDTVINHKNGSLCREATSKDGLESFLNHSHQKSSSEPSSKSAEESLLNQSEQRLSDEANAKNTEESQFSHSEQPKPDNDEMEAEDSLPVQEFGSKVSARKRRHFKHRRKAKKDEQRRRAVENRFVQRFSRVEQVKPMLLNVSHGKHIRFNKDSSGDESSRENSKCSIDTDKSVQNGVLQSDNSRQYADNSSGLSDCVAEAKKSEKSTVQRSTKEESDVSISTTKNHHHLSTVSADDSPQENVMEKFSRLLALQEHSTPIVFERKKKLVGTGNSNDSGKGESVGINGDHNSRETCENISTEEKENLPIDYTKYPALQMHPKVNDIVAFQMLKLSDDYSPVITDYVEAKVLKFNEETSEIMLYIIRGLENMQRKTKGRFDLNDEDPSPSNSMVGLNWNELLNAKLLYP